MTELTIYGRGGQGGVTLAKLIATTYFLQQKHAQAFGLYAAERSGAPIQAFVRVDDQEIVNHNLITRPDHVIVLDRTLIGPHIPAGMSVTGYVILNTPDSPTAYAEIFAGRHVATVDATGIAVDHRLGTRAVPIVNTTMLGAFGRVFGHDMTAVEAALTELGFRDANLAAAAAAYEAVAVEQLAGEPGAAEPPPQPARVSGLLDADVGGRPRIRTGTWATRQPRRDELRPPCNATCPAGNDVRSFVAALHDGDCDLALDVLLETSPFPGVCGRVCPAPCMQSCNRGQRDEVVNVRELERYAADHGRRPAPTQPWRDDRVAVVGSGPASLSAAYGLARLGYPVTLYESGHELGGAMRRAIPSYRLPAAIVTREIDHVLDHGIEVHRGVRIKRAGVLALAERYAALFVGCGQQRRRLLDIGAPAGESVIDGLEFLEHISAYAARVEGREVVVIGGGNTAVDVARTLLRLGARRVRMVYRRTRTEMPALPEEIDEALAEGVQLEELAQPIRLEVHGFRMRLTCARLRLGPPDESGRARPMPITGSDAAFEFPCDYVISAIGQSADLSIWPAGSTVHDGPNIIGRTPAPIFAGGDFATATGTVAAAIGSGRRAAWQIHHALAVLPVTAETAPRVATPGDIAMRRFARQPQRHGGTIVDRRSFAEVNRGLAFEPDHATVRAEAGRCMSCGVCNGCDACLEHCPEGVMTRTASGYSFDYDYCKGCGICATECPRGVISMENL